MLYVGRFALVLICTPAEEYPGNYLLVDSDNVYISTYIGKEFKWIPVELPFYEKAYFYADENKILYELRPRDSQWVKSKFTGYVDNGVYLYFFKRGKYIIRKRLVTVNSTNYVAANLVDVLVTIPLNTSYENIAVPNYSNSNVLRSSVPNFGQVFLGSTLGTTVIYYYYQNCIKHVVTNLVLRSSIVIPTDSFVSASIQSDKFYISSGYIHIAEGNPTIEVSPSNLDVWEPYVNPDGVSFSTAIFICPNDATLYGQLILEGVTYEGFTGVVKYTDFKVTWYKNEKEFDFKYVEIHKETKRNPIVDSEKVVVTAGQELQVQVHKAGLSLKYDSIKVSWSTTPF